MKLISLSSYLGMAILACCLFGCMDDYAPSEGQGRLMVSASVSDDAASVSRSDNGELAEKALIWISNNKGLVRKFQGVAQVPADGIWLLSGDYVAEAWTGDSVPASYDKRYYTGYEPFEITKGATSSVNINCRIANTVVGMKYAAELDELLEDYTMTVGHGGNVLTFNGRGDTRKGYYMMSSKSKDITWTLSGTTANGEPYEKTGVIKDAKRSTEYTINIRYNGGQEEEVGGGYFTIDVDESEIVVDHEIVIKLAPEITGADGEDLSTPVYAESGAFGRKSYYIKASAAMGSVVVGSEDFTTLFGLDKTSVDLMSLTDNEKAALEAIGLNFVYAYNGEADMSAMRINFEDTFTDRFTEGTHEISIVSTDADGRMSSVVLTYVVSSAVVVTEPPYPADVWSSMATLRGTLVKDASEAYFRYREAGTSEWTEVSATLTGKSMTASISGLVAGTQYEYVAVANGIASAIVETFTTEEALQLPNGDFEKWTTSTPVLIAADEASMFWDSGNHGSATLNKNVTNPDTNYHHGGSYSAKLSSQFVGFGKLGKFAAGNLFTGKYLKTDGMDGVLGWGRPFVSRPKALHGYVRYEPGTVEYVSDKLPEVAKGDTDKGIVYIAVLTDYVAEDNEYRGWPVVIKTKTQQLFDRHASNVIAYGEQVWDTATPGTGMIEFTINLEYYHHDIKASNIVVVASASKGGDYFVGGKSNMWLDDLTLIY